MTLSGAITQIGDVKDGPIPQMGPAQGKTFVIEIRTASVPAGQFLEIEISQDAAIDLVAKLTASLDARNILKSPNMLNDPNILK
jgi:hypothetical protein